MPDVHLDSFLDEPLPQDKINIQDKVQNYTAVDIYTININI